MPRKDRPSPLSDTIFRAKLGQTPGNVPGVPEEEEAIPVHNTFIQFGDPEGESPEKKHLATAPAWIGPSFHSVMQSAMQSQLPPPAPAQPSEPPPPFDEGAPPGMPAPEWSSLNSPKKLASPKKVPVMRYSMSASSARAAGIQGSGAVVAHYEPDGGSWEASPAQQGEEDEDDDEDDEGSGDERPRRLPVPPGELPSIGSAKHADGLCKRCCFFPKGRCQNALECEFCHYDHEKRKRKKKKKGAKKTEAEDSDSDDVGDPTVAQTSTWQSEPGAAATQVANGQHAQGLQLSSPPASLILPPSSEGFSPYDPAIWGAPTPQDQQGLGSMRGASGPPLSPPPALPPRGLPWPNELPPPASFLGQQSQAPAITSDPYYASGYGAPGSLAQPSAPPSALDAYGMPAYGARGYGEPPGYSAYGVAAGIPGYAAAGLQQANGTGLAAAQGYGRAPGGMPPPR